MMTKNRRLIRKLSDCISALFLFLPACSGLVPVTQRAGEDGRIFAFPPILFEDCLLAHGAQQIDIEAGKYQGSFQVEFIIEDIDCPLTRFSVTANDPKNQELFFNCAQSTTALGSYVEQVRS